MHNYSHQEFQLIKNKITDLSNSNPNWKGMSWRYKLTNGTRTGDLAITLIVEQKLPVNEIDDKDLFPKNFTIPGVSEAVKADVQVGVVLASVLTHDFDEFVIPDRNYYQLSHVHHEPWRGSAKVREDSWIDPVSSSRGIHRPLLGGISIGTIPVCGYNFDDELINIGSIPSIKDFRGGSGTLGGLCIDRDDNTVVGISNNHVIGKNLLIGTFPTELLSHNRVAGSYQELYNDGFISSSKYPNPVYGLSYYTYLCANDTTNAPNETHFPVYQRSYGDHWRTFYEHELLNQTIGYINQAGFAGHKDSVDQLKVGTVKRVYPLSATNNKIDVAIFALESPVTNINIYNYRPYITGANARMTSVETSDWSKGASNTTLTNATTDDTFYLEEQVTDQPPGASKQELTWNTVLNIKSGGTSNQYVELAVSDFNGGQLTIGQAYRVSFRYKWISKSENGQVQLGGTWGPAYPHNDVSFFVNSKQERLYTFDSKGNFVHKETVPFFYTDGVGQVGMLQDSSGTYEATIVPVNSTDGLRIYLNTDSGSVNDELQITNVRMIEDNPSSKTNTLFLSSESWKQYGLARQDEDMAANIQGLSAMDFATTAEIDSLGPGGINEGAPLFKSGRTTGPVGYPGSKLYTNVGQLSVYGVTETINVNYGGNIAEPLGFVNQIGIRGGHGSGGRNDNVVGSSSGDSGAFWYALFHEGVPSLSAWKVIGLNFAGATIEENDISVGRVSLANRIDNVANMFRLSAYRGEDLDIGYKNEDIKIVNSRSDAVTALIDGNMYWQAGVTNQKHSRHNTSNGRAFPGGYR